jgi:tRNA (cytidine32/uridine32-2'-O)-methyltransferase
MSLSNIKIILVNPSHPGNIGAVARAMKTMELNNLYLVNPKNFPHVDATARAAGADDILQNAIVAPTLAAALKDTNIVFGTSNRFRAISLEKMAAREAAKTIIKKASNQKIAILFGRESSGLTNDELEFCNYHLYIPANSNFNSLNLAAAVQLIAYEIKMANQVKIRNKITDVEELATVQEIQSFYQHLKLLLDQIKFVDLKNPRKVLSRLKILFNRAQPKKNEINILRGILTTIQSKLKT